MHSCVTRKPPRGVQSTLAAACALTPTTPSDRRGRAGDEAGQREHARRSRDRAARRRRTRAGTPPSARRSVATVADAAARLRRRPAPSATLVSPGARRRSATRIQREHVAGDREREHGRPDVDVERVEPRRRRGRPAERADPQRVEAEDQRGAAGRAGQRASPAHRVGEDRPRGTAPARRRRCTPA